MTIPHEAYIINMCIQNARNSKVIISDLFTIIEEI